MKRGFTLIEMLVVIGILGILTAIMIGVMSGATDSARATKCLANMRTLAQACHAYKADTIRSYGRFPTAGPALDGEDVVGDDGSGSSILTRGWTGWDTRNVTGFVESLTSVSMFETDRELVTYAYTNGAVWRFVGANRNVYRCPQQLREFPTVEINWSYLMNANFGWFDGNCGYSSDALDRTLLFAEVPFETKPTEAPPPNTWNAMKASGQETDGVLQYPGCKGGAGSGETIGCNHRNGNRWVAHVVFADAHVEKLDVGKVKGTGLGSDDLRKLTKCLCKGIEFSFSKGRYEFFENGDTGDD